MARKKRKQPKQPPKPQYNIASLEDRRWFVPTAFGFFLLMLIILFRDFIFSGAMLYGSDVLQAGVFFRGFYVEYVQAHWAVPDWNPYIFGGMPFVDAFHGDLFYPLSALKFVGALHKTLGLILFYHIFLAGVFMYFCARQFNLGKVASLFAGACYMFAPYLVSFVAPGHDGKIFVTTLFPLTILFAERAFLARTFVRAFFNASLVSLVIGVIIVSPHPQMSYFMLWALALFTVFRLVMIFLDTRKVLNLLRPGLLMLYAVIVGVALSAIQMYPGYIYTTEYSPRGDTKRGWEWATSWSMHEEEAASLLIPEFSGVSSRNTETYYWGKNAFKDNSESAGTLALFLGLIGAIFVRRRLRYFLIGLGLIGLLYALGATTPVFKIFFHMIPLVKSLRAPSMIMFWFSFAIALLGGMAVQWLIDNGRSLKDPIATRFKYVLWGFPALIGFLAIAFSLAGRGMIDVWAGLFHDRLATTVVQQGVTKLDVAYLNLPAIQAGAWFAFIFALAAAVCIWAWNTRRVNGAIFLVLLALPVINETRFNSRFVDVVDPAPYFEPNPVASFFESVPGHFRVMNLMRGFPEDYLPQFDVSVVTGYHGNQLAWYDRLLGGLGAPNRGNPRLLNLAGAEYVMIPGNQQLPANFFGPIPVQEIGAGGNVGIWRNPNAFPRAFLVSEYRVVRDTAVLYDLVLNGQTDLRRIALLEEEPGLQITADTIRPDSAWVIAHAVDSVVVGVNAPASRILILTDNWYDAWHAEVDGQAAPVLRAYGSFRAVAVPAGAQQVIFRYDSARYATGKTITWSTIIFLAIALGGSGYMLRREPDEEEVEEGLEDEEESGETESDDDTPRE